MRLWPLKTIGDICEVNPRLPRGHGITDEQIVSFVPMAAVNEISGTIQDRKCRPFSEVKKGYTHFKNGDVLFAKITPCMENGKAAIASDLAGNLGFGSTEFHVLRAKGEVLPEWLFDFVRQPAFRSEAKRNFTGTAGQQRVPTTFLSSATIPVPPIPEQRRIIDLLSCAEGIARLRRDAEKKAAELIPALFLEMFGDPARNPKGWKSGIFASVVADIRNGFNPSKDQFGSGTPFITVNNLYDGLAVSLSEADRVEADSAVVAKYLLKRGDLCFVRSSVKRTGVGMTSVFDSDEEAIFGGFVIRARLVSNVLPVFACAMFHVPSIRKIVVDSAGTGTITNINQPALLNVPIIEPPLSLQQEFVAHVAQIVSMQSQQASATKTAQRTFDAILAHAFADRPLHS